MPPFKAAYPETAETPKTMERKLTELELEVIDAQEQFAQAVEHYHPDGKITLFHVV